MNPTRIAFFFILLCLGCSSSYKEYQKPERMALVATQTPVAEGMIALAKGERYAMLQPMQTVYVTEDSLNVGNLKFVKITWGDSAGYVQAGWLIPQGKQGLITQEAAIYKDAQLKEPMDTTFGGWQLMAIGDTTSVAVQVKYRRGNNIVTAYVPRSGVSLETADIDYFLTNKNAGSLPGKSLTEAQNVFADLDVVDKNYTPKDSGFYEEFSGSEWWTDAAGEPIDKSAGEFGVFMNESKRNCKQNGMFDGMMDEGGGNYVVSNITVVVVPAFETDLLFKIKLKKTYTDDADSINNYKHVFAHVKPGKAYELTFPNWGGCSQISITVQTKEGLAIKRYMGGDCSLE